MQKPGAPVDALADAFMADARDELAALQRFTKAAKDYAAAHDARADLPTLAVAHADMLAAWRDAEAATRSGRVERILGVAESRRGGP